MPAGRIRSSWAACAIKVTVGVTLHDRRQREQALADRADDVAFDDHLRFADSLHDRDHECKNLLDISTITLANCISL